MDVKCLYSLYVVCFTALSVSCGGGDSSASVEREAAAVAYDESDNANFGDKRTVLYDQAIDKKLDEKIAALDTSRFGVPVGAKGTTTVGQQQQPSKRFIVPISPEDLGLEVPVSRPYFVHSKPPRNQYRQQLHHHNHQQQQQQQLLQQLQQIHHHHQQQQQQNLQPQQQQNQQQHQQNQQQLQQYSPGPYYNQGRGPPGVAENYGFGASSPGGGHSGYNEQSENSYQPSGGGENVNFDAAGFADFAGPPSPPPSPSGFRGGPTSPASESPAPFTASPPHPHGQFDGGGASGQQQQQHLSFDPTGFGGDGGGHDPSAGYAGGGGVFGDGFDFPPHPHRPAPVVHKSIYVHVAPPDDEPPRRQRVIMPNVPPKKNYQIVFIKAPTAATPVAPIIPPPPQHTDKTLIYVLHPKPEEAPPIRIPAPPATLPAKPEVYFIKYKQQAGLGGVGVVGGGGGGGGGGDDDDPHPNRHHRHRGGGYGGAGASPRPRDEFGGYSHRRYGRGDKTSPAPPAQLTLPPLRDDETSAESSAESSVESSVESRSSAETRSSAAPPQSSAESPPQSSAESPPRSSAETARPSFADDVGSAAGPSFAGSVRPYAEESSHRSYGDHTSRSYGPPPPPSVVVEPPSSVEQLSSGERLSSASSTPSPPPAESQLTTGGLDDVDMSSERHDPSDAAEMTTSPQPPPGPRTAVYRDHRRHRDDGDDDDDDGSRESAERETSRGGYGLEYNDASVDSSNLSESHAVLSAPKGKNGH